MLIYNSPNFRSQIPSFTPSNRRISSRFSAPCSSLFVQIRDPSGTTGSIHSGTTARALLPSTTASFPRFPIDPVTVAGQPSLASLAPVLRIEANHRQQLDFPAGRIHQPPLRSTSVNRPCSTHRHRESPQHLPNRRKPPAPPPRTSTCKSTPAHTTNSRDRKSVV